MNNEKCNQTEETKRERERERQSNRENQSNNQIVSTRFTKQPNCEYLSHQQNK